MLARILVTVSLLVSCAACPRPVVGLGTPRIIDQQRGVPKTIFETSSGLLDLTQVRRCQVVFEPAFSSRYAVWLVHDDAAADATVVVRIDTEHRVQSFTAALDRNTALQLSKLCLTTLTADFATCSSTGRDGVWYHAAHPTQHRSYAMATFWSPRQDSVAKAFVEVAEALRNFATLPDALRPPAWITLQECADELARRLAR